MSDNPIGLDANGNFIVGESVFLNYLVSLISLALFFGILITRNFEHGYLASSFYFVYVFILMPGIIAILKVKRNRPIVVINVNGIYHQGNLITNWNNFSNAYIAEELPTVGNNSDGLSDKFSIIITYLNDTKGEYYSYKVCMSGTQNRSEEEIIYAIEHFSGKVLTTDVFSI